MLHESMMNQSIVVDEDFDHQNNSPLVDDEEKARAEQELNLKPDARQDDNELFNEEKDQEDNVLKEDRNQNIDQDVSVDKPDEQVKADDGDGLFQEYDTDSKPDKAKLIDDVSPTKQVSSDGGQPTSGSQA